MGPFVPLAIKQSLPELLAFFAGVEQLAARVATLEGLHHVKALEVQQRYLARQLEPTPG